MSKKLFSLLFISSVLLLSFSSSCKKAGSVEINPEFARYIAAFSYGQISSASEIQIELAQDMPNVELNKEIEEKLFDFSPSIKGNAYWINSRTIKFVPEPDQLKAGTQYEAKFKLGKILKVTDEFKEFNFGFSIPRQDYKLSLLPYSPIDENDLEWNRVEGTLRMADVAKVDDIVKLFSLSGGEAKSAKIKVETTDTRGVYALTIDSLRRTKSDIEYKLEVNGSPMKIDRGKEEFKIRVPKLGNSTFEVLDAQVMNDGQSYIRVTFSDPVSKSQDVQGLILLNEGSNFSFDVQSNVVKIYPEDLGSGTSVNLTIYEELRSGSKQPLVATYRSSLSFVRNMPDIKILGSANILPNSENLVIPFQAVNLWAIDVKIIKIYENNILGYLQVNNFGESDELKRFGRLIKKKRIRLNTDPTMDLSQWNDFSLDLSQLIKQDPGSVYRVEFSFNLDYSLYTCSEGAKPQIAQDIEMERLDNTLSEAENQYWDSPYGYYYDNYDWNGYDWYQRDNPCHSSYYQGKKYNATVLASNIGITAKVGSDKKVIVALSDILTTKPLSDVQVDVYNYQMQKIGSAMTNGDGFASIEYDKGVPFAMIATKDKEKGYLKMTSNLSLSLSNFDVSGKEVTKGLKGYIYGERGVWRPGDSIFLTFILEDKDKVLPKDHPVTLEFYNPNGQLYSRTVKTDGTNGFYTFNLSTTDDVLTGNWSIRLTVGGVTFNKTIRIETVKPNRLKVRFNAGELINASKGSISGELSSQWLHGAPASNLKAAVEMTLTPVSNPFEGYPGYTFSNPVVNFQSETHTIYEGQLNSSGVANITAKVPPATNAPGMLKANIVSRVFESGGDASIYGQSVPYSPFDCYVGLKTPNENEYDWIETDTNNPLNIVTLTGTGKTIDRKVNVKVYKLTWSWWWSRNNGDLASYLNNTSTKVVLNEDVTTNGGKAKVNLRIDYPEWGRYLVMVSDKEGNHSTGKIIYMDWPASKGRSQKQDPEGLTMLSFNTDKRSYKVGEKATVIIPKSSNGRALISLENGSKIMSQQWITTSPNEDTKHTFEVTEDMAPNFYVSASLIQPHAQQDNELPIRMYGVLNVNVENSASILSPVITMPDELRPEKEFTVTVAEQAGKEMTYTLAVVDEGLLDLTAFKTPNAWTDFYARQSLGVRTWDMYDLVIGAHADKIGALLSIGGDEALKPTSNTMKRFKPVVKFLGPFTLKSGKKDNHKITLPPYFGSVRVMVVAGNDKGAYGNAEKAVAVKNPLMVLSTLPRVAGPEEEILLPVNVFAMDKKVKTVTVNVESSGLFTFTEGKSQTVAFTEEGDKTIYFKVKVAKNVGFEKVVIKATGAGETATETIDIEIRNPNPQVLLNKEAIVAAGDTTNLRISAESDDKEDWIKLEISRIPGVNLNKNLAYLFEYPHGCTEQISSKALPMLYVHNFRTFTDKEKEKLDYNIKEAIKSISFRQTRNGAFSYWPGGEYISEWASIYGGHFLIEAQRVGYEVPASVLNKWKQAQKKDAQSWNKSDLYPSYYNHSMSDLQQSYRLYTLALLGEPELGAMNRLKEMANTSVQARWRLAAAYIIAGKKEVGNQIIKNLNDDILDYSSNNNTYGSRYRDLAMIMETYLLLDQVDKAFKLSFTVSKQLSADYLSTQSSAFGLMAMSKLAEKMGKGSLDYEWELNGAKQTAKGQGSVYHEISIKPQSDININFKNKGQGQLFVRLLARVRPLGDNIPAQEGDVKLYVNYVDENNNPINITSLSQGTEFFANVVVQNTSHEALTDLALNHIFPSGWEIFNTRLFGGDTSGNGGMNFQDIRDDRVLTYFNLASGYSKTFKVRLQAAYCGRFYLPGISCEAMYKPEEQTRTRGQWVEVRP